jgi:zinc protease
MITVETVRENFPAVFKLLVEVLREPAFPESEFEQLRQEQLAQIEEQRKEPQTLAANAYERHVMPYPKGDIRYINTPDEEVAELKAATLGGVKKFYAAFYGASHLQMAVIGDFDEAAVTTLLQEGLGAWKSTQPFARVTRPYFDVPAVNRSFEAPDKANAFFIAGVNVKMRDDDPDYPALVMANYLLGGGFLNSRLAVRLRQKDGLSYGVGSQFQVSSLDQSGQFVTYAIYAPQNAAKLETGFKEEMARALKDGFTVEEVKAGLSGYLQNRQVSRAQDASLARTLANYLFLKRTLQWDADFERKVGALTAEQVSAALRKHIIMDKLSLFKAGDFAKK